MIIIIIKKKMNERDRFFFWFYFLASNRKNEKDVYIHFSWQNSNYGHSYLDIWQTFPKLKCTDMAQGRTLAQQKHQSFPIIIMALRFSH